MSELNTDISIDISKSRDLVLLRITSKIELSDLAIALALDHVSQVIKAEHKNAEETEETKNPETGKS